MGRGREISLLAIYSRHGQLLLRSIPLTNYDITTDVVVLPNCSYHIPEIYCSLTHTCV